ncbi:hypothetical protein ABT294_04070 [Nonomuraea sp. NPDC000554]|uniref:hypothetical protein n=1 Tax=Nonomuraea sp. NPDC000554 TaxID=3154259 RepID=UPI00332362FE
MPHTTRAGPVAALLGLALGLLALGPALGWGFILVQDMVFVPDPAFSRFTFGLAGGAPRVVPSDAVVTALSAVVPSELVQKLILLGIFALGCSGAALLVPSPATAPRLVAGACYVWNPYVAERLLMGQWALLLGYAGLPWAVRAAVRRRHLAWALLPAAVGGFAAMTITALTVLPVRALTFHPSSASSARSARSAHREGPEGQEGPEEPKGREGREGGGGRGTRAGHGGRGGRAADIGRAAVVLVAFSLPWLVPALTRPGTLTGDPVGVDAFAVRADGPLGALASLLSLGGIWNANAVPAGYETLPSALARLVLALAGIAAFALAGRGVLAGGSVEGGAFGRNGGRGPVGGWGGGPAGDGGVAWRRGLVVAAVVGFAVAAIGVGEAGRDALRRLVGVWGGFAVFRDAQQFVAPLALLVAVGLGVLTAAAGRRWAAVMVLVPLAVSPAMAWGSAGALEAVRYPDAWFAAREVIRADRVPGDVLVLPFESYRRFDWNGRRAVLDPAPRFFAVPGREVVADDSVRVGEWRVSSESERVQEVERVLEMPSPDLAAAGFRFVLVDAGTESERRRFASWLRMAPVVMDGPEVRLYRLDGGAERGSSE